MRIAVSKGHNVYNSGRFDPGAVCNPYVEADLVDQAIDILIPLLRKQGHEVFDVTPKNMHFKNSKEAHRKRADRVNAINPDIYLDKHLNAGGGTGPEMWVAKPRGFAYDYARKIVNNIVKDTKLKNRGVRVRPTMWSIQMVKCPAIILEGGFVDSKKDMQILTPEVYARSVAKAFGTVKEVNQMNEDKVLDIIKPSRKGGSPDAHWAYKHYVNINSRFPGIMTERRFDDVMTRGEVAKLIDIITKDK